MDLFSKVGISALIVKVRGPPRPLGPLGRKQRVRGSALRQREMLK